MKERTHSIDLGTHALRVETSGESSPVFVLLHGLVDTRRIWDRVAPALAKDSRVVRLDQRGHGESGAPPGPCTRDDLAADVAGVLDALGIPRAVLVGHSMGGIVSMTMALAFPERVAGLVLVGTASRCNKKTAAWYERIAQAGERDGTPGLARAIYGRESQRRVHGDAGAIAQVTRSLGSLFTDPLTPRLAGLACPVHLLVGEKDPMGPRASEMIQEAVPDATLEVVPGCGHWIHLEEPDIVIRACRAWRRDA